MNTGGQDVQSCKGCLYSAHHPLGLKFNRDGICSGCQVHEEKNSIDWADRWRTLEKLVEPYRSKGQSRYDCIVPVSGGRDSYFLMYLLKAKLKLNPVAVHYNSHFNTRVGLRNLARLREVFDVDILTKTSDPNSVRSLVRESLVRLGSVQWHSIAGQTALPVQMAVAKRIPLVIWGAHQGVEQVGMFSRLTAPEMSRRYRREHDLMGMDENDISDGYSGVSSRAVDAITYPADEAIAAIGVRGIYLSNYVRWDPTAQHRDMVSQFGYCAASMPRTFDPYDFVDTWTYTGLHDLLKQVRLGYGVVTDHTCREIRHGRLSRAEAESFVRYYSSQAIPWLDEFCSWLGASREGLNLLVRSWSPANVLLDPAYGTSLSVSDFDSPGQDGGLSSIPDWDRGPWLEALDGSPEFKAFDRGFPF